MTATGRVNDVLELLAQQRRPEAWISLRPAEDLLAEAEAVDARVDAGETLPLAGLTLAVKDNIDVAGLPTTAACPDFSYAPAADAGAVARLRAAGAIVIGKTNLDQFATGLVGTRSPYGAVRDALDPALVAGGSSSGSAVAVALGIADLALATDTAGSGRVPAAFQGIVGLKASIGVIPTDGVVPACRSFDCVSLMAPTLEQAAAALTVVAEPVADPRSLAAPLAPRARLRLATFGPEAFATLSPDYRVALERCLASLGQVAEITTIDAEPFLAAGTLLYDGAFVAERYAAVGDFVDAHGDAVDPTVAAIVRSAREITAAAYVSDAARLDRYRAQAAALLEGFDGLILPTAPFQPTIAEVQAEPLERNREVGRYVTFCNLLDMCAVTLPAGQAGATWFGLTLYRPGGEDTALIELAARLEPVLDDRVGDEPLPRLPASSAVELLVVGAHMSGLALNHELTSRGGRLLERVSTDARYRLYALDTEPPKPGLVRAGASEASDTNPIGGELWQLPAAGLADLLAKLPSPMALGRVTLADGRTVIGFLCEPAALAGAEEITRFGGWRAYLAQGETGALVRNEG